LADVIASGTVPVVRLTAIFRQAAQSRIITSAREGDSDFYFVQADNPDIAVPHDAAA
jgi:exodeoxyribonuclease V alpha subunit